MTTHIKRPVCSSVPHGYQTPSLHIIWLAKAFNHCLGVIVAWDGEQRLRLTPMSEGCAG